MSRCFATGFVVRRRAPDSQWVEVFGWLIALAVPATALAFLVGFVRWRVFVARAMRRFAGALSRHPRPEDLRTALADAFDDESLEIAYWLGGGGWVDAEGGPVVLPPGEAGARRTEVRDRERPHRCDRPRRRVDSRAGVRRHRDVVRA